MWEATRLTRSGRLIEAAAVLQRMLHGGHLRFSEPASAFDFLVTDGLHGKAAGTRGVCAD
jgi:hypothetical protein